MKIDLFAIWKELSSHWYFWFVVGWCGSIFFKIFFYDSVVRRVALGPEGLIRGRKLIKRNIEWGDSQIIQSSFGKVRIVHRTAGKVVAADEQQQQQTNGNNSSSSNNNNKGELIVLIHGFAGAADVFLNPSRSNLMEILLKEGYDVLTFDLFGHGYSESPDITFSAELFCAQLCEVLIAINHGNKPINILAHSMGSTVAITFAYRFPAQIKRILLIAPSISDLKLMFALRCALYIPIFREILSAIIIPTFGEGANYSNPGMVRACFRLIMTRLKSGGSWNSLEIKCKDMLKEMCYNNKFTDNLLILWGNADTVMKLHEETKALKDVIPLAKVCVCERADHMSFADAQEDEMKEFFSARIKAFFRGGLQNILDAKPLGSIVD